MRRLAVVVAALLVLCIGSVAQASVGSELGKAVGGFIADTVIAPDATGVVLGEPFTVSLERRWDIGDVPGLKDLDLYGGLTIGGDPPTFGGISTITVTNIKGTELCVGVRTTKSEDARWVLDVPSVLRVGVEPVIAFRRAI